MTSPRSGAGVGGRSAAADCGAAALSPHRPAHAVRGAVQSAAGHRRAARLHQARRPDAQRPGRQQEPQVRVRGGRRPAAGLRRDRVGRRRAPVQPCAPVRGGGAQGRAGRGAGAEPRHPRRRPPGQSPAHRAAGRRRAAGGQRRDVRRRGADGPGRARAARPGPPSLHRRLRAAHRGRICRVPDRNGGAGGRAGRLAQPRLRRVRRRHAGRAGAWGAGTRPGPSDPGVHAAAGAGRPRARAGPHGEHDGGISWGWI